MSPFERAFCVLLIAVFCGFGSYYVYTSAAKIAVETAAMKQMLMMQGVTVQ